MYSFGAYLNMDSNDYDVVIIGAGVGALVCGCFLAKGGVKTLIIEKNATVGGYCNTFKVKDVEFDGCVHALGNISEGSVFYTILNELGIIKDLDLIQCSPSDTVVTPDFEINLWDDINKTVAELTKEFPCDAEAIAKFFQEIINVKDMESVIRFRNKTFQHLLDELFIDQKLKSVLSLFILGDCGVPTYHIAAFTAIKHYQQFVVRGGFYPRGGISVLPNLLLNKFKSLGGEIKLSSEVTKIYLNNDDKVVERVELKNKESYAGKIFVANCDVRQTFFNLIGKDHLDNKVIEKIESTKPALSLFVVYVGLKEGAKQLIPDKTNRWYILNYNYQDIHKKEINYDFNVDALDCFLLCPNYEKNRITIFLTAAYVSDEYWIYNRNKYMDFVLEKVESKIPQIFREAKLKTCITPLGLSKWTMNYKGAAYGWAATSEQIIDPFYSKNQVFENLFLCGHWTTLAAGVPGVAIVGKRLANSIITKKNLRGHL